MGLFKEYWQTDNERQEAKVAEKVRKNEKDIISLKEIAFRAPLRDVKAAAIDKIDDVDALSDIVIMGDCHTRDIALRRITDNRVLLDIVGKAESSGRTNGIDEVVAKIKDKSILLGIAEGKLCSDSSARAKALTMCKGETAVSALCEILFREQDIDLRRAAYRDLIEYRHAGSDEILSEFEKYEDGFTFPYELLYMVQDQSVIRKIAFHDQDKEVRDAAADMLTNPVLAKKAKSICEHAGKQTVCVYENLGGRTLAVFEECKSCGRIFLRTCRTDDIDKTCILTEDRQHVFTRKRLGLDCNGVRVCYECEECGQCIYGYEEFTGQN